MASDHLIELMALAGRLIDRGGGQGRSVRDHADELGLPLSTAHRHVATLVGAGMVQRAARGRYCPGPRLLALSGRLALRATMVDLARPLLRELTDVLSCTAHLGVLENQMVSYLVKEGDNGRIFSREGLQLEAYCSALGKILLAGLEPQQREAYLADDEFVALTPYTKVRPDLIAAELDGVHRSGFALDLEEVCEGLRCLALPVFGPEGICAAISVSRFDWRLDAAEQALALREMRPRVAALSRQLGAEAF